jgi:hypothetical protein
MKFRVACLIIGFVSLVSLTVSQTSTQTSTQTASALPRLVRFGGTVKDLNGNPMTGVVGITFAFYSEKTGGSPLWLETQNATADGTGHYTVLLGSTKPEGLPAELFTSEQARWVGVQVSGQPEQPRVLLVSAPYALKAGDAETIGGLPPSAFVLAAPVAIGSAPGGSSPATIPPPAATDVTTTGGTLNYLPIFSGATTIIDSAVFQTGSGTSAKVGINTTTPVVQLDVNGSGNIRGTLSLPATGVATATVGKNSQPLSLTASAFNSTSSTALNQVFHLQAEPAGNDTTAPSGTLNLLFGEGATAPSETGLKFSSKGLVTFATGQTFPGVGSVTSVTAGAGLAGGTITKTGTISLAAGGVTNTDLAHSSLTVTAGTDLTGGGLVALGGATTLKLDTTKVPTLAAANNFTSTQTLANGALTGNTITAEAGTFTFLMNSTTCCSSGTRMVWAHSPSFPNWGMYYDDNVDFLHIRRAAGGEILTVDFSGLVGINNATPAQALDVNGSINTTGAVLAAGDVDANGNVNVAGSVVAQGDVDANGNVNVAGSVVAQGLGNFGSSTITGQAVIANNTGGGQALQLQSFQSPAGGFVEAQFNVNGTATFFTDALGDTTAIGTKSAAVPLATGEMVKVFSTESPEVWFEDFGFGQLNAGIGKVTIDPSFIQTASMVGYHVFVTPKGDCKGLYVTNEANGTFEVRELGGGQSNVEFDYRIVAHRKGYEALRLPAARMPKPIIAAAELTKEERAKHMLALPPAKRNPNPQLLYRASAPVRNLAPGTAPKK